MRMPGNILSVILDASEYFLQLATMLGAVLLIGYAVYDVINEQSYSVLLYIITAALLLVINVMMRSQGHRGGAG